jgi:hypothetical protein
MIGFDLEAGTCLVYQLQLVVLEEIGGGDGIQTTIDVPGRQFSRPKS